MNQPTMGAKTSTSLLPRNPTQLLKNVGFHYRSTQPTIRLWTK